MVSCFHTTHVNVKPTEIKPICMYSLCMSGGMYGDMAWFMSQLLMVGRVMLPGDIALLRRLAPHESLSSSV